MLRYSVLRALIFFGCLSVLWLFGLRGQHNIVPLVLGAAIISMAISFFALRRFREDYSQQIAEKLEARAARKAALPSDEKDEDAEIRTDGRDAGETYR